MTLPLRKILLTLAVVLPLLAAATDYDWTDCQGSAKPYPIPSATVAYPDTLTPVMINHVGRHGARFPSSAKKSTLLLKALTAAEKQGTITPQGEQLKQLTLKVIEVVDGHWGALDSLGMAEQQGIATRMINAYPELFRNQVVKAYATYVPRCIMSMDCFTHQLAVIDNTVELSLSSGRRFSPFLRFFELSAPYEEFRKSEQLKHTLHGFEKSNCPTEQLSVVLGDGFNFQQAGLEPVDVAMAEYSLLAGLEAMGLTADVSAYLTSGQQNRLWSIANMSHYLEHSSSVLSQIPSEIAAPLLDNLISTTDSAAMGCKDAAKVILRFGHAETLMPLLALMKLPGCCYVSDNLESVATHWHDFHIVPMASNLQLILFRGPSGACYLRVDLNEVPVPFISGSDAIYVPWAEARSYFESLLR